MYTLNMDITAFLTTYWQKRPVVIRQAFKDFQDPITPEELAGLAMESDVESRMVTHANGEWDAKHGPFHDFKALGDKNSSLLVQATNHWLDKPIELAKAFRFIPNWRFDDVMASYGTPQGGVGPHIDNYDVFIIQGQGRRHWRVGEVDTVVEFAAHEALLHCEPFDAIIDVELEPGDMLYIPPRFPHEGYSLTPSMSFSVGFRAPDACDLLSSFVDYIIDHRIPTLRYADPDLTASQAPGLIQPQELQRLRTLMQDTLNDDVMFAQWIAATVTHAKHDMDIVAAEVELTCAEVTQQLAEQPAYKAGGLRVAYLEALPTQCFIDGELWELPAPDLKALALFANHDAITAADVQACAHPTAVFELLTTLINQGYWYFDE